MNIFEKIKDIKLKRTELNHEYGEKNLSLSKELSNFTKSFPLDDVLKELINISVNYELSDVWTP